MVPRAIQNEAKRDALRAMASGACETINITLEGRDEFDEVLHATRAILLLMDEDAVQQGQANLEIVREYLRAIEDGAPFDDLRKFFAPDVIQREFPNRLVPNGATRRIADLAAAAESGRKVVTQQRYEVLSAVAFGARVALEVRWTGTLAIPFGSIPAGGDMTAHFGVFFELEHGKIRTQNNYDCFDPW